MTSMDFIMKRIAGTKERWIHFTFRHFCSDFEKNVLNYSLSLLAA